MKTMMLLVLPAVAMLITLSVSNPTRHNPGHINHMIDMVTKYKKSISVSVKKLFVEDVSLLAEGSEPCGNKFFCKVHQILENHEKIRRDINFVHVLETHINETTNVNCTETLKNVTTSVETKPILVLLDNLLKCCQHQNLNASKKSNI